MLKVDRRMSLEALLLLSRGVELVVLEDALVSSSTTLITKFDQLPAAEKPV